MSKGADRMMDTFLQTVDNIISAMERGETITTKTALQSLMLTMRLAYEREVRNGGV